MTPRPVQAHRRWKRIALGAACACAALLGSVGAAAPVSATAGSSPIGYIGSVNPAPGGVRITGWALDKDTTSPISIEVRSDGARLTVLSANVARDDVLRTYPSYGANHGFDSTTPIAVGTHQICVFALNVGGGSNLSMGCRSVSIGHNPIGHLDSLVQVMGGIRLVGWVADPDTAASTSMSVRVDGRLLPNLVSSLVRTDVAKAYPNYGAAHGFDRNVQLPEGRHQICAYAVNVGIGTDMALRCVTMVLNYSPLGYLGGVTATSNGFRITGWTLDPDGPNVLTIVVRVDGATLATMPADVPRADVGRVYPSKGANHGFDKSFAFAEGTHLICVLAVNVGPGSNRLLGCIRVAVRYSPLLSFDTLQQVPNGLSITGWAFDPNTASPIKVDVQIDKTVPTELTAGLVRPDVAKVYPTAGPNHGFAATYRMLAGAHTVCVTAMNVDYGANSGPTCRSISLNFDPRGVLENVGHPGGTTAVRALGWAADPDTTAAISVELVIDGKIVATAPASLPRTDLARTMPGVGPNHGFQLVAWVSDAEHVVTVVAVNAQSGQDRMLGSSILAKVHPVVPSAPVSVTATAGYGAVTVAWQPPVNDGGAPITGYLVRAIQNGTAVTVSASGRSATLGGLKSATPYSFTVTAINQAGYSTAAGSPVVSTLKDPPPQTTPAPISTSRYIRNIKGVSTDLSTMRSFGATDAAHNPSGHSYLLLLDIGGQDYAGNGVVLSATPQWVSNTALVAAVKAYVDGYASRQLPSAPAVIAIGTNNDMDVSAAAGAQWARNVVNPIYSYGARYTGLSIAGANDIEPGFSGTAAQSRAWLSGYLGATPARFVFNGSADGCNWAAVNGRCNNGWSAVDLQWLAGGAAPTRIVNLPQIYNNTMAQQWKFISLTGVVNRQAKINFGGPLTEYTACQQAGGCGSLTGNEAWTSMWSALRSDARISQSSLPHSTDLRIN